MEIIFQIAADLTVTLHMGYALFIVLGQAAVMTGAFCGWKWVRNTKFRILHLVAIAIVVGESWLGITCPLTTLEKHLRSKSDSTSYEGDFIANFVHDALFVECAPWVFTTMYSLFGLAVLITLILCPPNLFARELLTVDGTGNTVS
jgi:polyferredoxin